MDPGFRNHVFPQIIAAYAHQLCGVQGASAQIGGRAGVGSKAFKVEIGSHNRVIVGVVHLIDGVRVPGINKIHLIEQPGSGHELFGTGPLLCRTAKIDDCAAFFEGFQIFLDGNGGCQSSGTQGTVSTSVARCSLDDRLSGRAGSRLV